jgi:hypothetical protein
MEGSIFGKGKERSGGYKLMEGYDDRRQGMVSTAHNIRFATQKSRDVNAASILWPC